MRKYRYRYGKPNSLLTLMLLGLVFALSVPKWTVYAALISSVIVLGFWYYNKNFRLKPLQTELSYIDNLSGMEFEKYLNKLFHNLGYRVTQTPKSGDYGADLILQSKNHKICVQAKRYSKNVGIKAVQEVIGSLNYYNGDQGMVVTNSYFTKAAKSLAYKSNIELIDRDCLCKLLQEQKSITHRKVV